MYHFYYLKAILSHNLILHVTPYRIYNILMQYQSPLQTSFCDNLPINLYLNICCNMEVKVRSPLSTRDSLIVAVELT